MESRYKVSNSLVDFLKSFEALRLKAYLPTKNDKLTIGYGHTAGVTEGMTITKEQAEELFRQDIKWAEEAVNKLVKVGLTQNQYDALVSLMFNIGETRFNNSDLLRKLNNGDYESVPAELSARLRMSHGVGLG